MNMKKDSFVYIIIYLHRELKLSHFTLRKGYQMNFSFTFTSLLSATGLIIEKWRTITFLATKKEIKRTSHYNLLTLVCEVPQV